MSKKEFFEQAFSFCKSHKELGIKIINRDFEFILKDDKNINIVQWQNDEGFSIMNPISGYIVQVDMSCVIYVGSILVYQPYDVNNTEFLFNIGVKYD